MQKVVRDHQIFLAYENSQIEAARVLEFSLRENSSLDLNIQLLGRNLVGPNYNRPRHPLQSTDFTFFRFCIPELCGFQGTALYLECDMLVLADISEVLSLDMDDYALRVVKQNQNSKASVKMVDKLQTSYVRKNWSSFMLMDCSKLQIWDWEAVNTWAGLDLHQFAGIPDCMVGEIPSEWNSLDHYDQNTKNLHYTAGGPWLGIDHPYGSVWTDYLIRLQSKSTR